MKVAIIKKDLKVYSGNIFSDISDHLPNFVILCSPNEKTSIQCRPYIRLYTPKNKDLFCLKLSSVDWQNTLYCCSDVNDGYIKFISVIKKVINESFPLVRQSRRAFKDKKWMTGGLKDSCKQKEKLYRKWRTTNNAADEIAYKSYKIVYCSIIKKAEANYYSALFDNKINSIKKLWSNLNNICSAKTKSKNKTVIDKLKTENGNELVLPLEISNYLNSYFCNIGNDLVDKLPLSNKHFTDYLVNPVLNTIFVEPVTTTELTHIINLLKNNKNCGIDGLSCKLLQDYFYLFCDPLNYLYNLSLTSGIIPDDFKLAKVVPVYKKGERHLASNFRPISLLNVFNKILEKIVHRRLYSFLDKNNILYKYQFGFRKNYSTSLALLEVVDSCYKNLDKGNKVLGIYFDLQKAFDTVDHDILLAKLHFYGIRGTLLAWFKNYLKNRKQYTVVNNVSSSIENVTRGVPQGSVLGPLLFLIYINDMNKAVSSSDLKLFADDTNLFLFNRNLNILEDQANMCIKELEIWFAANKLSVNIDKTCYAVFKSSSHIETCDTLKLLINGQQINKVTNCKYLGVFIDDALKWDVHIEYVYKKIVKFTSILYKLRNVLPKECLKKIYFAFINPYISYGVEVYANCSKSAIDKLNKLINKLLRILLNKPFDTPVIELYKSFNILPIFLLHDLKLLEIIFKYYYHKNVLPTVFHDYFVVNESIHNYNTRSAQNLHIASVNSNVGQKSILYKGSKLWNELPENLKAFSSASLFKKSIIEYLLKQ